MSTTPDDKVELRQLLDKHLACALDAFAMLDGMERRDYIELALREKVQQRVHASNMVQRVLRGNPLLTDADGGSNVG